MDLSKLDTSKVTHLTIVGDNATHIEHVENYFPNVTSVELPEKEAPLDSTTITGEQLGADEGETSDPDDDFELPAGWESYPDMVFTNFKGAVEASIKEAGATCIGGSHYACLMAVCDDHSCLKDRSDRVNFSRAMLALRLYKPNKEESCEDAAKRLANNMNRYINQIRKPYKEIPETTPTLKKLHEKCASLGIYFDNHYVRYRFKD